MKICVIGLGSMGKRRIRLLKEIDSNTVIVGIDKNKERALKTAEEYGVDCYADLSNIPDIMDCAFVCTPPQYHAAIIKECLERNLHVFSEINLVSDKYEENGNLAKQKNKVLFLSSTPLYKKEMQIISKKVKQNGKPCAYQYHTGQYLPDWHPWDNLKDFFVSNKATNGCREIFAIELPWIQFVFGEIKSVQVKRRKLTSLNLDFPDTYLVQLEHENGNVGSLTVDVVSRQAVRRLEVFNEGLYIRWEGTPDTLYEKDIAAGVLKKIPAGEYIHKQGYDASINEYAYRKEIEAFFQAISDGKEPIYDFEMDQKVLSLIDEIEGQGKR